MTQTQTPEKPTREAHVRPEDVKKIGGAQSIDDKVETWQRQLEATESRADSDTRDNVAYYGALIAAFLAGSLMSGFSMGGGDGGGGVFIGLLEVASAGVLV